MYKMEVKVVDVIEFFDLLSGVFENVFISLWEL